MEYTKEQYLADLTEMKAKLQADFEAKADQRTAAMQKKHDEKMAELTAAFDEVKNIKPEVTSAELKAIKDDLELTIKAVEKFSAKFKAVALPTEQKAVTFESRLKDAVEANYDNVQKFIKGETKSVNLELKAVGVVNTAIVSGSANFGIRGDGKLVSLPNNIGHIRSLIPTRSYEAATDYYFMREVAGEGAPAPTAEGILKPQFDIRFQEASVKFEWIAGWMLLSRKALMNIPGLMSTLNSRLPEKLLDVEDAQALYGNGISPNWKGILTAGNFVAGSAAGATPLVEKIINDITLLEDTHKRMANGIAMRPAQYNSMFIAKASGSGEYDLPQGVTFVNGQLYILGVPVAKTTALAANDYVVGDFQNGAEILIGEAMNIRLFEEDSTNVRTNEVTVRIEEYAALPVMGNSFFVKGSSALI